MSHWNTGESMMNDINTLATALRNLGFKIEQGKENKKINIFTRWQQGSEQVNIKLADYPSVGFRQKEDGTIEVVGDDYDYRSKFNLKSLNNQVMQRYNIEGFKTKLTKKGWRMVKNKDYKKNDDGSVTVLYEKI